MRHTTWTPENPTMDENKCPVTLSKEHNKVFSDEARALQVGPPQLPWICTGCGKTGFGTEQEALSRKAPPSREAYDAVQRRFTGTTRPLTAEDILRSFHIGDGTNLETDDERHHYVCIEAFGYTFKSEERFPSMETANANAQEIIKQVRGALGDR